MTINQKTLWEKLAQENSRYFINTDKGRSITEEQFRDSGKAAYKKYIADDKLIRSKQSILDYGCGVGRLTEFMAHDFKKVIGVDISGEMIKQAKERLRNLKNIDLIETNGESIPLPKNSCNFVFSYLVFQHQKSRSTVRKSFKEICRVLKPKGIFKVLLRNDKQKDMNSWWSGVEYNEESIRELCKIIGFTLLKLEYQDKYAFWLWLKK